MKKILLLLVAAVVLAATMQINEARADRHRYHRTYNTRHAAYVPWHAPYYHAQYGQPVAMVVPPTARMQSHYGWGVTGTRVTPIHHQFGRPFSGYTQGTGTQLHPTPRWPSDTDQFGVYYIRGPY